MENATQKHEELVERAIEAVKKVYSDASVDQAVTKASLEIIRDELDVLLDTLD